MDFANFVGPSYQSQSPNADGERCLNLVYEPMESPGAATNAALYPAAGFMLRNALTTNGRGITDALGRVFTANGSRVNEIGNDYSAVNRYAALSVNANPVTWATSGNAGHELALTSGEEIYILDLTTNVVSPVEDGGTFCGYIDGFFVALDAQTSTFKISDLLDGTTWDPTQVVQRVTAGDPWIGMLMGPASDIYLVGSRSTDVYYNAGVFPFPFQQNPGVSIQYGTNAPFSMCVLRNTVYMLGQSYSGAGIVLELNGYQPNKISTFAVDTAIQSYTRTDDCYAVPFQDRGHDCVAFTFPSATDTYPGIGRTWVWDATTRLWHQRLSYAAGQFGPWRPQAHVYGFGQHLTVNRLDGALATLTPDSFKESNGDFMRFIRRAGPEVSENKRITYPGLQLHVQGGVGVQHATEPLDPITLKDLITGVPATVLGPLDSVPGPFSRAQQAIGVSLASASFGPVTFSGTTHTWEVWLAMGKLQGPRGAVLIDTVVNNGLYVTQDGAPGVTYLTWRELNVERARSTPLQLDQVYYVVVTLDSFQGRIYINGQINRIFSVASGTHYAMDRFFRNTVNDQLVSPSMSNVAIYDTVLSGTKIAAHYAARTATDGTYANLVAANGATHYWPMDDPTLVETNQEATVTLRISRDGGHTFGNDRTTGLGTIGQYDHRVRWIMLGQARQLVTEVEVSQASPFRILGAWLQPDPVVGSS